MTPINAILERLTQLHPKKIDMSLDRMERALASLGDPHKHLPPVIHVAGTNGKGSTTAFMRAMLEASGRRVHVYTSPHLVRFHERFRLAGTLVDDETLAEVLLEVERRNGGAPITQFEITTAAGFLLFSRHAADVLLLEVGMGGRLDATNVIDRPRASVITSVSMDHADYLGDTVPKIAGEKAGIIKRGRPVVVSRQTPDALAVIEQVADKARARLSISGLDWFARQENGRFVYQDDDGLIEGPAPKLPGAHQFENAGTAIAALSAAGFKIDAQSVATGLTTVSWPARLQRLTGKLTEFFPKDSEIWLDGGHNIGGGEVLAEAIREMNARAPRPLIMICGMISTKDPRGFLGHFAPLDPRILTVPFDYPAGLTPEALAEAARSIALNATPAESFDVACAEVRSAAAAGQPPRVLITGSLYLAGEILIRDGSVPR
jgi:dihydrofolate synthase/folylpolyglutamate synthase